MATQIPRQIPIQPVNSFQASFRLPNSPWLAKHSLLIAALADGDSQITGALFCDDSLRILTALNSLGFEINMEIDNHRSNTIISGKCGKLPAGEAHINIGEDLDVLAMLAATCTLGSGQYIIDGSPALQKVDLQSLFQPFRELGANIAFLKQPGCLPIQINGGKLKGGAIKLDAFMPGKVINALLIIAPYMPDGLTIEFISPLRFRPHLEMALLLMQQFGVIADINDDFSAISVKPTSYQARRHEIEPDAAYAGYFLAAAAITHNSKCTLQNIGSASVQPNASFALVLQDMGATATYLDNAVTVESPPIGRLMGIDVDMSRMSDMIHILAATAVFADAPTTIRNVGRLREPDYDALEVLQTQLIKIGVDAEVHADSLIIDPIPAKQLQPATIQAGLDPRLAMSFAIIGLQTGGITIDQPQCVFQALPPFFDYLKMLHPKAAIRDISPAQLPGFTVALGDEL